jgi:hypothetical protein
MSSVLADMDFWSLDLFDDLTKGLPMLAIARLAQDFFEEQLEQPPEQPHSILDFTHTIYANSRVLPKNENFKK